MLFTQLSKTTRLEKNSNMGMEDERYLLTCLGFCLCWKNMLRHPCSKPANLYLLLRGLFHIIRRQSDGASKDSLSLVVTVLGPAIS